MNKKNQEDIWKKKGIALEKKIVNKKEVNADIKALQSMFIGFQIAITPIKAPLLVASMMSSAKESLKLDKNSLFANVANANILFYFPEAFGGNKQKAIDYYKNVYNYFLKDSTLQNNWMFLNVMSTIAVAYDSINNIDEAYNWVNIALNVEPDFNFVNTILKPKLDKKRNL